MRREAMLAVVSSFLLLDVASGCSCHPSHPQDVYCRSSTYALTGVVTEAFSPEEALEEWVEQNPGATHPPLSTRPPWVLPSYVYTVRVTESFINMLPQLPQLPDRTARRAITTEDDETFVEIRSESVCGARLSVGLEYFIAAPEVDGSFTVGLCDIHEPLSAVSEEQLQQWRRGWVCDDCEITSFGSEQDPDHCIYRYQDSESAQLLYGQSCIRNSDGVCEWTAEA